MGWNLSSKIDAVSRTARWAGGAGLALLAAASLVAGSAPAAFAQGGGGGGGGGGTAAWAVIQNSLIRAELGESGTENNQNVTGRFRVTDLTTGNVIMFGPTVDLLGVSSGVNVPGSFLTVRIDGGYPGGVAGTTQPGWDLIFGETGTLGQTNQSTWFQPPTVLGDRILARWGTLPGGVATNPIPPIEVTCEITLIHDVACYKFTVYNGEPDTVPPTPGTQAHTVGLRFAQNYTVDDTTTLTEGPVYITPGGQICTETLLTGASVPSLWTVFDAANLNPIGGYLKPTGLNVGFIQPDAFLVAGADLMSELWTHSFTTVPNFNICAQGWDAAVAVYWNPQQYGPNQQRTITTYFGKQTSNIDFGPPWEAGVAGPRSLSFDPSQPAGKQLTPNPFAVNAFIHNPQQLSLTNANATISLPPGLALAPGQTATMTMGSIAPSSEGGVTWQVVPTGAASGTVTYSVAFSAGPGTQGKVVTRNIDIPSLPTVTFPGGLEMVSFPFTFANPDPAVALGISSNNFALLRWNPRNNTYEAVQRLNPGEGYWLNLNTGQTLNLAGATPTQAGQTFEVKLQQGWNQIGNPFATRVGWSQVQVVSTDVGDPNYLKPLSISDAAIAGLILPTLYSYDPVSGQYKFDENNAGDLVPFQGYWVKALKANVSLLVPAPIAGRAVATKAAVAAPKPDARNWKLQLVASNGTTQDGWNFIGIATNASDGADRRDIEKPPAIQGRVALGIVRGDWGSRAGLYAQDLQSANGGAKTWTVQVTSPQPRQDVTLTWPDIATLPKSYELYVTDSATGEKRAMRSTSSIRVNTGDAASATVVVTAVPRSAQMGAPILRATVRPSGNRASMASIIEVQSSRDVNLTIRVKGANGLTVRTLGLGRAATSGGTTQVTWDLRDERGNAVPSGIYTVDVEGTTSDHQVAHATVPYVVTR